MTEFLARGGHVLGAQAALVARVSEIFADPDATPAEYVALRAPVEIAPGSGEPEVRTPRVFSGWPNPEDRGTPKLPFVAIRPTAIRVEKVENQPARFAGFEIVIATHVPAAPDYDYAWAIAERIWRPLAEQPYLDEGLYGIDAESIEVRELAELAELWPAYVLGLGLTVWLPAILQTQDERGNPLRWEAGYGA